MTIFCVKAFVARFQGTTRNGRDLLISRRRDYAIIAKRSLAATTYHSTNINVSSCLPTVSLASYARLHGFRVRVSTKRKKLFSTAQPFTADAQHDINLGINSISIDSSLEKLSLERAARKNRFLTSDSSIEEYLIGKGITSRPRNGGKWNVHDPLGWTKYFGRRSKQYEDILRRIACLKPGDDGYYDVLKITVPQASICRTKEQAKIVLEKLKSASRDVIHACDTEVMDIDLNSVGPVGHGYVTCLSIYSGPDFDYGLGEGPGAALWIDNLDDSFGLLQEFKEWFENEKYLKVWHNYGFDRHVMWNEGINVKGFGGDTMHMARLLDTSRENGYSLESLTADLVGRRKRPMKEVFGVPRRRKDGSDGSLVDIPPVEVLQRDPTYRSKWIRYSCFDAEGTWLIRLELEKRLRMQPWQGTDSLFTYYWMHMRPFGEVLTDMERRGVRVDAANHLAKVELLAREDRARHLDTFRQWASQQIGADGLALNVASAIQMRTFLFGGALNSKTKEPTESIRVFQVPREDIPADALQAYTKQQQAAQLASPQEDISQANHFLNDLPKLNAAQLREHCRELGLRMGGKKLDLLERIKDYYLNTVAERKVGASEKNLDHDKKWTLKELKQQCRELKLRVTGTKAELLQRIKEHNVATENDGTGVADDSMGSMSRDELRTIAIGRGLSGNGSKDDLLSRIREDIKFLQALEGSSQDSSRVSPTGFNEVFGDLTARKDSAISIHLEELKRKEEKESKYVEVTVKSIGLKPEKYTSGGMPSVTADVLRKLAGDPFADPPKKGTAYDFVGEEGCKALYSLCAIGSIDTMITNFITSLQELADDQSRVHCSLNLNTETGRLSSRRPNLQNQPALEKDKYKIRAAFQSSPGNNLIIADYGQLELRLLASLTECNSMIDAFAAGGDFHSRTAIDMFPHVYDAVKSGDCLLEWDYTQGQPTKPLLKDMFASERRKAKTLNFSIAYGKTAHGLSQDWGVSKKEAEDMLEAWYNARPEVKRWQLKTRDIAQNQGITRTLMGRYRQLPAAMGHDRKLSEHALRASINTPIQGGAADIAMMAMNKINASQKLHALGWILLLQIHDEVMLEGPEETAEEAFEEVLLCMQEPWVYGLEKTKVPLTVDGSWKHKNWYDAK